MTLLYLVERLVLRPGFASTVGTVVGAIVGLCSGLFWAWDLPLSASVILGALFGCVAGLLLGLPARFVCPLVFGMGLVMILIPSGMFSVWPLNLRDPELKYGVGLILLLLAYVLHRSGADEEIVE